MSRMGPREPVGVRLTGSLSLNDLLWVANTRHGPAAHWHARPRGDEPDHDHLSDPADARRYLADHRVPVPEGAPPPAAVAGLRAVRETVHGLIAGEPDPWTQEASALLAGASFRLGRGGRLVARGEAWEAFVADLLPPLVDLAERRDRLGRCGNPACRLAFLDDTRNRARRWCDPGGCGNRVRVRRARRGRGVPGSGSVVAGSAGALPQPPR
jgi:predicted RNA-binding Zn ribbon-like protein